MKLVKVSMPDGSEWGISTMIVAYDRARFIMEEDLNLTPSHKDYFKKFEEEVQFTLLHLDVLIEWVNVHMTWDEVSPMAFCLKEPNEKNYYREWEKADKTLVDTPC